MNKLKNKILIFLIMIFVVLNTTSYAGYSFSEIERDIDNIEMTSFNGQLTRTLGFNTIHVPYVIMLLYIIVQIILIKKHKNNKLSKRIEQCLKASVIAILIICLTNNIINNFVIDQSKEVVYITSTMFIHNSFLLATIINIVINTFILVWGMIFTRKLLKNNIEENEKRYNKKILIIAIALIAILSSIHIFMKRGPLMHMVEVDWSFGRTIDDRKYDVKIYKGKNIGNTCFLAKEIDTEGVLIEYKRGYYEEKPSSNNSDIIFGLFSKNYDYKTEIVQQKMKWNTNYRYEAAEDPRLCADGGTNYYVRFEK